MFCVFWGCYQYGGISSPILPLAGHGSVARVLRSAGTVNAHHRRRAHRGEPCGILWHLFHGGIPERVAPNLLVALGLISTFCASIYVSMMALYYANVVSSQAELEQEVKLRRATEQKLREATEQAERAMLAKSEFLAKMSWNITKKSSQFDHWIQRDSRSKILGRVKVRRCKDLQTIREAGHRLLELIDDLLDLSKLEAGKMTLHSDPIDFRVLFNGIAAKWRSSIVGSNEFVIEPPADRKILIDVSKLRRVIEDLLSNAVKFTKNGRITFSASTQGDTLTISVEDNGAGISERQIGRLFETFDRSENETASNYGDNVRLGLPLAYRYCRFMGGELSIQSD